MEKIEKLNYKGNMWVRARADANTPTGLYVKSIQQSSNSSESNNMSYGNRGSNRYGGGGRRGGYGGGSGGGDRFGNRSMGGPKPVEVGKEYDVDITELSRRGDGVAKIQGFIIFVRGSKVGEKVKIKVDTVGPRFATASVVGSSSSSSGEETKSDSSSSAVTEPVS